MMTVSFFDMNDNLVARFTVEADTPISAAWKGCAKYNKTPNAEFKPLDTLRICVKAIN